MNEGKQLTLGLDVAYYDKVDYYSLIFGDCKNYQGTQLEFNIQKLRKKSEWPNYPIGLLSCTHRQTFDFCIKKKVTGFKPYFVFDQDCIDEYITKIYKRPDSDLCAWTAIAAGRCRGVYIIYLGEPGRVYVGEITKVRSDNFNDHRNFRERWIEHEKKLRKKSHENIFIQSAFNRTGIFIPMILNYTTDTTLEKKYDIKFTEKYLREKTKKSNYNIV